MVPSAFVVLEAMPLTANGKVDRKALAGLKAKWPEREKAFVAPQTPTEEGLAKIWSEVLGLERLGIGDNFFELGGNSLMAIQVISRIRKIFQVGIPVNIIFTKPTISDLALLITQLQAAQQEEQAIGQIIRQIKHLSEDALEGALGREMC